MSAKRWLQMGVGMLVLGGGFEGLAMLVWPEIPVDRAPLVQVETHPAVGYRLVPNQDTFSYQARVRTDADGRRIASSGRSRAEGRQILVVGGSETFGKGVSAEQAFPARVDGALGPDWAVINAGTPDWNLGQSVAFVEREGLRYRPQLLVQVLYWDDLFFEETSASSDSRPGGAESSSRDEWFLRRWAKGTGVLDDLAPLYTRSRLLYLAREGAKELSGRWSGGRVIRWRRALLSEASTPELDQAWRRTKVELKRLARWGQAHRVDILLLVLPMEHQEPTEGSRSFQDSIVELARHSGLKCVDASQAVLTTKNAFLAFDGRPSSLGHAAIAEVLAQAIQARYQQMP